jgi:hypothetical protein
MNIQLLIDSIVRQVTVLIAQVATSGGVRAPIAHLADQVFVELSNELQAQGVSRKVSADMFGMALRPYIRKLRRLSEGKTDAGKTLWQAVLDFISCEGMVTRARVLERFSRDDKLQVNGVLRDLTDSGLIFVFGKESGAVYRAATESEIGQLSRLTSESGLDELVWVLIYRDGPLTEEALRQKLGSQCDTLSEILNRLLADKRVEVQSNGLFVARDFIVPLGSPAGWEAAVFDHFQALVRTVCLRLQRLEAGTNESDIIGGSTYTFDVWPGHPMEDEVKRQLRELRERCGELLRRVETHNREHGLKQPYEQVVLYAGQSILERELEELNKIGEDNDAY